MEITKHYRGNLDEYPQNLQLYESPPSCQILLHDFEEMALERLRVLKVIDTVNLRGHSKFSNDWREDIHKELNKQQDLSHILKLYDNKIGSSASVAQKVQEARRRDHISHFILCMAFCCTDELRNWFLSREMELFHYRYEKLSPIDLQNFLDCNNLDFRPIPIKEKESRKELLKDTFQFIKDFDKTDFYKVPFRRVVELVKARRVLLERGQCYVISNDLGTVLASKLRQTISHSLAVLRQSLPETSEDHRLDAVLKCLLDHYEAGNYRPSNNTSSVVRVEDLNDLSKKSFPPCMRRLHEALVTKHHLRHGGRQQYQLFLKGIGLPMDECLRFWRSEFLKAIAPEKFEREHAYNIRHNYGQEGNRTNYSPYGCNKIIQSQPGPDDCHGCPFRHSKPQDLRRLLLSYGINNKGLEEVLEFNENQHYTLACQKLFVLTHEKEKAVEFGMCHPNQYFSESRSLITGISNKKPGPATPAGNSSSSNYRSPAATATPGSAKLNGTPKPPSSQGTPLSTKTPEVRSSASTPTSRRTLTNPLAAKPAAEVKAQEMMNDVNDWMNEDEIEQLIAMETQ